MECELNFLERMIFRMRLRYDTKWLEGEEGDKIEMLNVWRRVRRCDGRHSICGSENYNVYVFCR